MSTTTINHYGHNVDVTEQPFYCTDCEVEIDLNEYTELNKDEIEAGWREHTLRQYSTRELQDELERRGYVNGVLINPSLDQDDE